MMIIIIILTKQICKMVFKVLYEKNKNKWNNVIIKYQIIL